MGKRYVKVRETDRLEKNLNFIHCKRKGTPKHYHNENSIRDDDSLDVNKLLPRGAECLKDEIILRVWREEVNMPI